MQSFGNFIDSSWQPFAVGGLLLIAGAAMLQASNTVALAWRKPLKWIGGFTMACGGCVASLGIPLVVGLIVGAGILGYCALKPC
jgi:hypothetical protein